MYRESCQETPDHLRGVKPEAHEAHEDSDPNLLDFIVTGIGLATGYALRAGAYTVGAVLTARLLGVAV